jgi:1-acyl-sn-glycerol-3-phosphate acyltransferase
MLAVLLLVAMGLGAAAGALVEARRWPLTWPQRALFAIDLIFSHILWRAKVRGRWPFTPGQGAVIVANHRSSIDPFLIALGAGRLVHWMVAKEFYLSRLFGWMLRLVETIPVNRGGIDTAATKAAIRRAREGGVVGLFPEGRINGSDQILLPGRPGAALIALKARVPVVPCFIRGSPYGGTVLSPLLMPARVEVIFGTPMDLSEFYGREDEREVLEELTRRFLVEIARLGGCAEFQPRLAGRFYKPGPGSGSA